MTDHSNNPNAPVIVIGAGIIGSCCALQLARLGHRVVLIDQHEPGSGCSFGNAGSISSGSITPMAMPGIWKNIPAWLSDKHGPLAVRWRYFIKAAPWLMGWLRASGKSAAIRSAGALSALHAGVLEGYQDLLGDASFSDLIKTTGHVVVHTAQPTGRHDAFARDLRASYNVASEELDQAQLQELVPGLSPDFTYGVLMQDGGFTINPQRLVQTLVRQFVEAGGQLLTDKVVAVKPKEGTGIKVITRTGEASARNVVIATGAWSRNLVPSNEPKIPLETERGYHVMLYEPSVKPSLPVVAADYKFFSSPMEEGLRLAGTVEIAGLQAKPNWGRAEILLAHAKKVFPNLQATGSSVWMGHRPSIPDSVPVIAPSSRNKGIFYAFGHGHLGLSGAPGTARIVSNFINDVPQDVDISPFGLERFSA